MKIVFLADSPRHSKFFFVKQEYYSTTKKAIEECKHLVVTSQLCFISFDLLYKFDEIELIYKDVVYKLKLGTNTWTEKHLRKEHNLFKLVQSNILNQ